MKTVTHVLHLVFLLASIGTVFAGDSETVRPAMPVLNLNRGISIDRQLHSIPPKVYNLIHREDIRLIKSMKFQYVKIILNPDVLKSKGELDLSRIWYLDQVVQLAVDEQLPVVVCIHPMPAFKQTVLNDKQEFSQFVSFIEELTLHIATRWTPNQIAFQLMTEPFASSENPEDWNHWDKLQHQLWAAIRGKMPQHTLILSGDLVGSIDGLLNITPVDDDNVLYAFSFYDPQVFTQQGIGESGSDMLRLKNLPFPSGPQTITAMSTILATVPEPWKADITRRIEHYAEEQWDTEKLAARIDKAVQWRKRYGDKPRLWCSEFGCYEAAPATDRRLYLDQVRTLFDQYDIGWCYWSYNETFTVMAANRTRHGQAGEQTPDKALLHALMPEVYPEND